MELNNLLILNIMNSGISLIMGLYMFFLQRTSFKLGTGYWAIGSLIIGLGLLIKAVFPIENSFAMACSPLLITIGLYLYLAGIWKFKEIKIHRWIIIGIPILDITQTIIFLGFFHAYRIQIGFHLLLLVIYCLLAIFEMIQLNNNQKYLKKIFLLNAASFTIFLILLLLNIYALITTPNIIQLKLSNFGILMQIISGFVMIALTFGFLSAVNIRLNKELNNQLDSKTKFLSIIAHDLRGPVGNIMNFLDLIQNETDLDEKDRKEYLKILNTLSHSTFHLLQNLLEWATNSKNLNSFKSERIELSKIISNNLSFFRSSSLLKSINLNYSEKEQIYITGNVNMIQTILRNLVSNAIKFTPEGGTINILLEKKLDTVRLSVEDTGQGIKSEIIKSLFKFETNLSTKGTNGEAGSGLGLVLCKELISKNNGLIEIESKIGVGTKVIVEFPAKD